MGSSSTSQQMSTDYPDMLDNLECSKVLDAAPTAKRTPLDVREAVVWWGSGLVEKGRCVKAELTLTVPNDRITVCIRCQNACQPYIDGAPVLCRDVTRAKVSPILHQHIHFADPDSNSHQHCIA